MINRWLNNLYSVKHFWVAPVEQWASCVLRVTVSLSSFNHPIQVTINVSPLPSIVNDELMCVFGRFETKASMRDGQVVCALPDPENIPPTPETQGETYLRHNSKTS